MKILLGVDGSPFSEEAIDEVIQHYWPAGTEIRVICVAHAGLLAEWPDPIFGGLRLEALEAERKHAQATMDKALAKLQAEMTNKEVTLTSTVLEGSPKKLILEEADKWGANLIVIGSHGRGAIARTFLGSVSLAVASQAKCSVKIVRNPPVPAVLDESFYRNK